MIDAELLGSGPIPIRNLIENRPSGTDADEFLVEVEGGFG
jgi:hypothetical protein